MAPNTETVAKAIRQNIETIARLESDHTRRRTVADRIADRIGNFSGTMTFVSVHAVLISAWIVCNLGMVRGVKPFDPFPFLLLSVALSIEAIFLSTFVLIKQSRMSRRADERAALDLQINLLAENEMTLVLQMLQAMCLKLGVQPPADDLREMTEQTSVEAVANELQRALDPEQQPTS